MCVFYFLCTNMLVIFTEKNKYFCEIKQLSRGGGKYVLSRHINTMEIYRKKKKSTRYIGLPLSITYDRYESV